MEMYKEENSRLKKYMNQLNMENTDLRKQLEESDSKKVEESMNSAKSVSPREGDAQNYLKLQRENSENRLI